MKKFLWLLIGSLFAFETASASVEQYYQTIQENPNGLYAFLKAMPKGGELHYHLAGGAYPERMLQLIGKHPGYCINSSDGSVYKNARQCRELSAYELKNKPGLYRRLVQAWSMQDFVAQSKQSKHDHFFGSFIKFIPIVSDFHGQLLVDVVERAAGQNELYMEIMDLPDDAKSASFAPKRFSLAKMALFREHLLANTKFQKNIQHTIKKTRDALVHSRQLMRCESNQASKGCGVTVKMQYYVMREQPIAAVFAQALNGFEAAHRSNDIVAVNLVQPEDGKISLRDYRKQMRVFAFMHQQYPDVHISLHAGEVTNEYVSPEHLRFHIREAIEVGHAERIGHGVDVAKEDDAEALLTMMAQRPIPVEINLESNRTILNVAGKAHPLTYYLLRKVPVVLSTDDEGILRTDLTTQYVTAAYEHGVSYNDIKQMNRNALTYSFLDGVSLWQNSAKAEPVSACVDMNSKACDAFVETSPKARLQRSLEQALLDFEAKYA